MSKQQLIHRLGNETEMKKLHLSSQNVHDEDIPDIMDALCTNTTVTSLRICVAIGLNSIQAIANVFKINTTLNTLYIQCVDVVGAQSLIEGLKDNTSMKMIALDFCGINDIGAQAIAEALKSGNTSLTTLYLNGNEIGDIGAQAIAESLKVNASLTTLYLHKNQIGDTGARALAEALKGNTSLTKLYLSINRIGPAGAQALAEVLKENTTLMELDLDNNQIGDTGAQAFAEAIMSNTSLPKLYLDGNQIGDAGAQALAKALKNGNISLIELQLGNNNDVQIHIKGLLIRNKNLKTSRKKREQSFFSAAPDPSDSLFEGQDVYQKIHRHLQGAMYRVDFEIKS